MSQFCFTKRYCVCYYVSTSQAAETQDGESAFGSDSSSVLDWKPSESITVSTPPAPTTRKALSAITVQVRERWKKRTKGVYL